MTDNAMGGAMSLFLLTFFLLYSGVHVYTLFKAKQAIGFGVAPTFALALFLLLMVLAPVLVRVAEKHGMETVARFCAYAGYVWMGGLFLFFCAAITIDLYRLFIFAAGEIFHRELAFLALSAGSAFFIPLAWAILTAVYGYFEAWDIRTERVVISSPKIPRSIKKLTIVQISDVHLGLIVREERLARILAKVKAANPDILVSTGDLVDGQLNHLGGLAELFKGVTPHFGKFAVTGNHEFISGVNHALEFTEQSGFKILRGESSTVAGLVTIAGIDDPARGWGNIPVRLSEKEVLSALPQGKFILLLKHRPAVEQGSIGLFDLQLSGHVHKGQIFPFNLVTYLFYPVKSGYSILPQKSSLYVSRGTGTWGPPIRFLAPPELTVIELIPP
jgi:predicted MPP superfamily phosphohydrolase